MRAAVIVVGDLGRSPRMQHHARALASGVDVDFIGHAGAKLAESLTENPRIAVHPLTESRLRFRVGRPTIVFSILAAVDALVNSVRLGAALLAIPRPDLLLVQNPPAIPTLPVAWMIARLRRARFVIDWHNLGYSILALRLGRRHVVVRLARWVEMVSARLADGHLSVSQGLSRFLTERFRIRGVQPLYDWPLSTLAPPNAVERDRIRQELFASLVVRESQATGFIVCPAGWTANEDFDLVIEAVQQLEEHVRGWEAGDSSRRFPDLVILVTGDGLRRVEFERRFAGLSARRAQLRTRWLDRKDYPRIVGSADVGLCLHRSSSGLDIPMKVADLFAAGLPVCALDYGACLAERVRHGVNGLLFSNGRQLAELLFELFQAFPRESPLLDRLRKGIRRSAHPTWEEAWATEARQVLLTGDVA
jgi:beta-1,4-mannosyltransferase